MAIINLGKISSIFHDKWNWEEEKVFNIKFEKDENFYEEMREVSNDIFESEKL